MESSVYGIIFKIALLLFAAKIFGEVASRFGFPSVLGEIVAGLVLGPSLLGWVKPTISIQVVANIGIMLLLFLAGLEIDLDMVRRMGAAAFLVALFGVVVPFAGGTLAFMGLGKSFRSAVFIGSIMSATSIGLTLRTLMDIGQFRTREGTTIVTAAVIDDVIGIFILSILISAEIGGQHLSALYVLKLVGLVVGFFAVTLVVGWWLAGHLTRFVSRLQVDEALLAFAICATIALGWLASNFKVAEITGAFVAGLIFNRTAEQKVISDKISVIGYGFFIPIFFAYIGVTTRLGALRSAGYLALVFVSIAILGKIVGCGLAARPWFKTRESLAIGVGMIPRAEVALIMATLGYSAHVIDSAVFAMTVTMVFVTNIVAPVLIKYAFKWARGQAVGGDGSAGEVLAETEQA